jgi:predicted glycosyltransferase involved in capsule biosynthesis
MDAEIIQGHDFHQPFSKAVAVNQAALMARGRVLVILDADTYLAPEVLTGCVTEIETALRHGRQTWYMPYDRLYRLNKETTDKFLLTNPLGPAITARPAITEIEMLGDGKGPYWPYDGHQYGAMAQIIPREAFIDVGGMDPRFRGWGSEDVSLLRALDTLWGHHEVAENQVLHLWHARIGSKYTDRQWVGQSWGAANSRLAQRYAGAIAEPGYMAALAAEHPLGL